jgi:SusD/RagB-like outer membrane lipoprotein
MLHKTRVVLVSLGLGLGVAGCNSFLTGDKLSSNPNSPSTATIQTLFVAMQGGQFAEHEGPIAMLACEWVQQCGATSARFVELGGRYDYGQASNFGAEGGDWATIYDGGGFVDIRGIEAGAKAIGDSVYLGVAKIWEAFTIGLASDMWSGVPYTQVTTSATPDTDSQFAIYDSVQSKLTQAINELTNDNVATHGPLAADLVFGGLSPAAQRAAWIATAWSLKARYWLHVENAAANGKRGALTAVGVYDSAIAAASKGISDPTGASDFRATHFTATTQQNMWSQFQQFSGFGSDLEAGKPLVDYMNARGDPRVPLYFCKDKVGGYGGDSFNQVVSPDSVSNYVCLPPRFAPTFGIPYVTYSETQLILAEACNFAGTTGCGSTSLQYLNNVRAVPGEASLASLPAMTALVGITGAALTDSIMMEKWVVMYQNIESLMDYRRTCLPAITPVAGNFLGIAFVPGRLFYPQSERNVNPTHMPLESTELSAGLRTQADITTSCHP